MGGRDLKPFLSVYGHVTVDQIASVERFLKPGITADITSKKTTLGGTGPNIAVTAARLGCPTALCAYVGSDFPQKYVDLIRGSGVITDDFRVLDGEETSTCMIINDKDLQTHVFFYQGPQGRADSLGVRLTAMAKASEHAHFCTGQPSHYISLMEELRGGPGLALDPAQEVHRIWNGDLMRQALPMAESLFCNELEAETICRYLGLSDVLDAGPGLVVNTMGAQGSRARCSDGVVKVPVIPGGRPVDVTGAGDAYRAGFYTAVFKGYRVPEALVLASSVSSFVVEAVGALTNTPRWEQVVERAEPYLREIDCKEV